MKRIVKQKWHIALTLITVIVLNNFTYAIAPLGTNTLVQQEVTLTQITIPKIVIPTPASTPTVTPIKEEIENERDKFIKGEQSYIKGIIWDNSKENGLDPNYVLGICLIETGGTLNPQTLGPKTYCGRAKGICQLMPVLTEIYGVEDPFDPEENIKAGTKHLKWLMDYYGNKKIYDENENLMDTKYIAAIAYNWGQDGVDRMIKKWDCIIIERLNGESRRYLRLIRAYCEGDYEKFYKILN